jgi:S-adenosyl-L-methionine hydrolase (adenosine-forming)
MTNVRVMAFITLTTDWNNEDFYVAAVKGTIFSLMPEVNVVDISHRIDSFNIAQGAFVLRNSFKYFPEGTVHIIDINSELFPKRQFLAVKAEGHFFIGTDNGIFGLILKGDPESVISISSEENHGFTFPCLSVFTKAAVHLAAGGALSELGSSVDSFQKQIPLRPTIDESTISGSVIYIDSYRNAMTNITADRFERVAKGRQFEIFVQSNHYKIKKINKYYNETPVGEILAVFNSLGLLEIAINNGNAAELLNLNLNSSVRVKFY